ncbi:hypothetical protein ACW4YW_15600, partial [Methylobacillus pratensis]
FVDYQNTYVNPRTDLEYDGLNNIVREIVRGKNDNIETDDHITRYEYNKNGFLSAEIDATNARTEYAYDANGNVTRRVLKDRRTADQVLNNQVGVDDVTVLRYDALNQQVRTTDQGTGLISEIRYNGFGEITGKRSYVGTAPITTNPNDLSSGWQEFAQYDQAGRVWKSNSADGITKVYLHDKQGNATLTINGTLDMRGLTLDQVLAHDNNSNTQKVFLTYSVFDERNQLTNTIQPSMDGRSATAVIETNANGQSTVIRAPSEGSITASNGANTNPITAGNVGIGTGIASWTLHTDHTPKIYKSDKYYFTGSFGITVPNTDYLGDGNVLIEGSFTLKNSTRPINIVLGNGVTSGNIGHDFGRYYLEDVRNGVAISVTFKMFKSTAQGKILIGEQSWSGGTGRLTGSKNPLVGSGNPPVAKNVYISNQPVQSTTLLLMYRSLNSSGPFNSVTVPQVVNAENVSLSSMYAFDWSSIPAGEYEYQYLALNSAGEILNAQGGTFNTTNASAPTVSPQTPLLTNGAGGAIVTNPAGSPQLNLIGQGSVASSVALRYRIKGSGGAWSEIPSSSFVPGGFGVGSFTLPTSALGVFVNGVGYDIEVDVR